MSSRNVTHIGSVIVASIVILLIAVITDDSRIDYSASALPSSDTVSTECRNTQTTESATSMSHEVLALPASFRVNSNSFVRIHACDPSVLSLSAMGTPARGLGARLTISSRNQVLFDELILDERRISVVAPDAGWLVVAFSNDYYDPPADRNLWLNDLHLRALKP